MDRFTEKLTLENFPKTKYDLAVSYSYCHILPQPVIDRLNGNIVNLHISYLPWNRGENPNQWSFLENTPQGVTIHYLNAELDKGDILAQQLVPMQAGKETLASSYRKLNNAIQQLFQDLYPYFPYWPQMRKRALGRGTYHSQADFTPYAALIATWDMPVAEFLEKARQL